MRHLLHFLVVMLIIVSLVHIEAKKSKAKKRANQYNQNQGRENRAPGKQPTKPKQQPNSTNNTKSNVLRSEFVTKVELPLYQLHYNATVNTVRSLINAEKYNFSIAYAVNAFTEYRIRLLSWIYGIKGTSLTMCKNPIAPEIALCTVVFTVFNSALERLDLFHEEKVTTFEKAVEGMFAVQNMNATQRSKKTKQMLRRFRKNLEQYEIMAKKTRGILRSALSFL